MNIQKDFNSSNDRKPINTKFSKIPKRKNTEVSKIDEFINIKENNDSEIKSMYKNEEADDIVNFKYDDIYETNRFRNNKTKTTKDESEDFIK